jgi:hypothetical protein
MEHKKQSSRKHNCQIGKENSKTIARRETEKKAPLGANQTELFPHNL